MTPGRAAYAKRRHSCELQRIRAERAQKVAARRADPGVRRDCFCKQAKHQHGTYVAFVIDRCTCRPCRDANAAYERRRQREIAYGRWQPYVDAEPARQHVRELMRAGIGLKRIPQLSGVPHGALSKLIYGGPGARPPSRRIRLSTSAALLAVPVSFDALAGGAMVNSSETIGRLRSLVAAGWSQSQLARRIDVERGNFFSLMNRDLVSAATVRKVRALYTELRDVAPPEGTHREKIAASRARNYAAALGWPPPGERRARPVQVAPPRSPAEVAAEVVRRTDLGESDMDIATALGVRLALVRQLRIDLAMKRSA